VKHLNEQNIVFWNNEPECWSFSLSSLSEHFHCSAHHSTTEHCTQHKKVWQSFIHPGRYEVRWRPGQEASLAPPCSNLRTFGSKCTVLKQVITTLLGLFGAPGSHSAPGEWSPPCAPLVTPLYTPLVECNENKFSNLMMANLQHERTLSRYFHLYKICAKIF